MKYSYKVIINSDIMKGKPCLYDYGNTRGIAISYGRNKATLSFELNKKYSGNGGSTYLTNLIKDGLKRIALAHVLKYEKAMSIKLIRLIIIKGTGVIFERDVTSDYVLYSMISNKGFNDGIPPCLKKDSFISKVVRVQKTKQGSQTACLYAYLLSKQQDFEMMKFLYTWMAFNGFYNAKYHPDKPGTDTKLLNCFVNEYKVGEKVPGTDVRKQIGQSVMYYLNSLDGLSIDDLKDEDSTIAKGITKRLVYKGERVRLSAYGYILVDFAYYLRCSLFHANSPAIVFAFEDDMELKAIRFAQSVVDVFLRDHITEIL